MSRRYKPHLPHDGDYIHPRWRTLAVATMILVGMLLAALLMTTPLWWPTLSCK